MAERFHLHVLVVGLGSSPRWRRAVRDLRRRLPAHRGTVHRVIATDGRRGLPARTVRRSMLGIAVQTALRRGAWTQPLRFALTTPEAVACAHSHWRCWRWLAAADAPAAVALVLEDDFAFDFAPTAPLIEALAAHGLGLDVWRAGAAGAWDYVQCGWLSHRVWSAPGTRPRLVPYPAGAHRWLWGSHCYALSQAGARRLLRVGVPFELHVDYLLSVAAQCGLTRGWLLSRSCCGQRPDDDDHEGSSIPHGDARRVSWKAYLPDAAPGAAAAAAVVVVAVAAVVVVVAAAWIAERRSNKPRH